MENNRIELGDIVENIKPVNESWLKKAEARTSQLLMPARALGRLHDISEKICAIQKTLTPFITKKAILVMAGDHGIVAEGVSAYPQEITGGMVQTFLMGGAGINVIADQVGIDVQVVDMGIIPDIDPESIEGGDRLKVHKIAKGTSNFINGPAMTRKDAKNAVEIGFQTASQLLNDGIDILGTGDMGIGNTTPSAAIGAVITGTGLDEMVGRGTGVDDDGLMRKRDMVRKAIEANRPTPTDSLDVLGKVGGFEIGGIAGSILAAAYHGKPVVVDGFISTAGALIAHALCPTAVDYMFAGHRSEEPGHNAMLKYLGLEPVLDLGLRLGEGTGAALAMGIMDS
ncbi:MAG: nicotinate-nucleotide--dimethylbenzimidazole phosphoribosyltransferase, partial [bacterium]|nr:nicotinate-nucleotide--dimethylbenzimidazole phosphoribosyltransferase [bacterium]